MPSRPESAIAATPTAAASAVPANRLHDAAGQTLAFAPFDVAHACHRIRVRTWRAEDAAALARAADHPEVPRYLRDRFPHPYTVDDARDFLTHLAMPSPIQFQAIEVDAVIAGGIGFTPGGDVERHAAELGYWLTPSAWGRGIMTTVVRAYVPLLFERFALQRVWSKVYGPNKASMRVLEGSGFRREGLLRNAVLKNGELLDAVLYARIPGDGP